MKIALLFPGYGSQYVGMAKELYDESRIVQEYFEEASNCLPINFVKLCFASSDSELSRMENAYSATFLVSCAIHAVLKEEGIKADIVAGYNLGEYAALYAVGAFTFPDGLYLLNKYAAIYQEELASMDVAALRVQGVPAEIVQELCARATQENNTATIGLYTGLQDVVVTGDSDALSAVRDHVSRFDAAQVHDVALDVGLHSALMQPVAQRLTPYLEKVDFKPLDMPLICSADVCRVETGEQVKERVIEHIYTPVKWTKVMASLASYDLLIEVGPGTLLGALAKAQYPDKVVLSINKRSDITDLKKIIEQYSSSPAEL